MCSPFDALPPDLPSSRTLPAIAGAAASELVTLISADGTEFAAAVAESAAANADTGVIVLPDARGLYPFYERLAERFADAGHHALAIDYFGRTACIGVRDDAFDFMPHLVEVEAPNVQAEIVAGIDELRTRTGATSFITVGFCFGGSNSFLAATNGELGLAGAVGFYGGLDPAGFGMKIPSPVDLAPETKAPVLGLFGGGDPSIPQDRIDEFAEGLHSSGVSHEIHVYPNAPHSFFDRSYDEWQDACADAWNRVLDFIERAASPVAA